MIEDVIARLSSEVPDLNGRTYGAGNLAELTQRNALPQHTPAAHVIPLGLVGRKADAGAGAFTQFFEEACAIILTVRNHNAVGKRAMENLRPLIMSIVEALAGWAPDDAVGVFRLARGSLVSSAKGTVIYQIDFSITDQLRIFP